ncbi:DUF885 family protein [Sphingopyxis sp. J-6]|uniref:DUF885 domain-containing protein n=1 Tax=Sphingopyxis sp. J-6 TaxID=3122054 RepID=UPI0039842346
MTGSALVTAQADGGVVGVTGAQSSEVLADVSDMMLYEAPETATSLGVDKGVLAGLRHRLTDRSLAGAEAMRTGCAERLRRLRSVPADALAPSDALDLRAAVHSHELADEGHRRFPYGDNNLLAVGLPGSVSPYAFSQGTGFFATIPAFLESQHPVETRDDVEAYLDRLRAFAKGLDGETERLKHDAALGVVAPSFILDRVIGQQRDFAGAAISKWSLVSSLSARAAAAGLAGDWEAKALELCERDVGPAIARQTAACEALRRTATEDAGCSKFPDGEAYYDWALRVGTTTTYTPGEIHKMGLEQVAALDAQMDSLFRQNGMDRGTVGERVMALNDDPRQLYADSDAGRAELIAYLNDIVTRFDRFIPRAFQPHHVDFVIERVAPAAEASAPAGYQVNGALDGSRPAAYFINLRDMRYWPKFTLPTLTFHEGIPGHVWQGSFTTKLPRIRSQLYFNAYLEGWGLYAEQLADELGFYDDDPLGRIGYLQSIQFRACRLVVDTGIHALGWSRQKAIDWLIENNALPADSARDEIDRYCVWPGQACGYQIGQLELVRLRDRARKSMGGRFDLPAFHAAVLMAGPVPLTVLSDLIEEHIQRAA